MKRIVQILVIFGFVLLTPLLQAQERNIEDVKNVVCTFFASDSIVSSRGFSAETYRNNIQVTDIKRDNTTYLYVVNMPDSGWAIVSNEQRYSAIIGYSTMSHFDTNPDNRPEALKVLLGHHMNMIDSMRESHTTFYNRLSTSSQFADSLTHQRSDLDYALLKRDGLENLWRQDGNYSYSSDCDKVYNKLCPVSNSGSCNRSLVGCTAVALAQVAWYWRWPDYAIINDTIYAGVPSGQERRHYYDWDHMPTRLINSSPLYQVDMVAGLLRDCGYAEWMLYGGSFSSAGPVNLGNALENTYYFHYNSYFAPSNATIAPILQYEIQHQRPVICQGTGSGMGNIHTFVIDGYKSTDNTYHVNWGQGAGYNGMFDINLNGYTIAQTFFTELYPDCSIREASVSGLDISTITSGNDVTLYSANNVSLSQLTVASGGHLNVSAGGTITLGSGFNAQLGSVVNLSTNYNCSLGTSPAPVSAPKRKDNNADKICSTNSLYVTPNPAFDEITLKCDMSIIKVFLYSINGQIVLQTTDTQIDISHLSKGIYIIRAVTEDGGIIQTKLIHM